MRFDIIRYNLTKILNLKKVYLKRDFRLCIPLHRDSMFCTLEARIVHLDSMFCSKYVLRC